jgi:phenylpropionate dioxygenase-like ring-hydroxylating dioxygenase large terminal subunit
VTSETETPLWIRAAASPEAFRVEQDALGKLWTCVGFTTDLPNVGDWFRTNVGGKSIFVQRFEDGLRAFRNICAHRFYPLRIEERGNGPVLCGFHHWRYNSDGIALGIPDCPNMYGCIPREVNARIEQLDLDTCGAVIFVRFRSDTDSETLRDYLGDGYTLLATFCRPVRSPHRFRQRIKSNWKFSHHISLDDYHIVAVHPTSFGKQGYLKRDEVHYHRFGRHSAYSAGHDPDHFAKAVAACVDGTYHPDRYVIVNFFPNVLIVQLRVPDIFGSTHWYGLVQRYAPISHCESEVQGWLFKLPFDPPLKPISRLSLPVTDRLGPPVAAFFAKRIIAEDNAMVEGQQSMASEVRGEQRLSAHEARIGWFEEAYRAALEG